MKREFRLTEKEFLNAMCKGLGVEKIISYYVPNFLKDKDFVFEIEGEIK